MKKISYLAQFMSVVSSALAVILISISIDNGNWIILIINAFLLTANGAIFIFVGHLRRTYGI